MSPKISIIIPAYNSEKFIKRTIQSVLNQTYKNFELIIVDDGSTDNTKEIVREFQKKDPKIKYIWEKNSGAPARPKNRGIKRSKGEYIAFLDHDDEWMPEKLEKQLNLFEKEKNLKLGFISSNGLVFNEKENKTYEHKITKRGEVFQDLLANNFILSSSSVLAKKEVFKNVGFFDENLKFSDDWEMWIKIAQKYEFDFFDEALFKYYWHGENVMNKLKGEEKLKEHKYILEKYKDFYQKYPRAYSVRLRNIGSIYLLNNNLKEARRYFVKAVKVAPFYLRSWINFILSLFGKNFYKKILYCKKKTVDNFVLDS